MPFLSVLIPVYNGEDYLASAIESALNQPCKDLEVIVANDGSTDDSLSIARRYEQSDSRVHVVSHENVGPGQTRNEALPLLKGSWIIFLDCDDIILPDFYTDRMRDFLAFCSSRDVETIVPCRLCASLDLSMANMENVPFDEVFGNASDASWNIDYEFATLLYTSEVLRRNNIRFGITRPAEMESIFRHKAVFCSKRTLFTNKLWFAVRRENPHQTTRDKTWASVKVDRIRYEGFSELIEWHKKRGTTGFVLEEAMRRRDAAKQAIEQAGKRTPLLQRMREKREYRKWKEWRNQIAKPLAQYVLSAEQQRDAIAELTAQIESAVN